MRLFSEKNIIKKIKLISLILLRNVSSKYIPEKYLLNDIWDLISNTFNIVKGENFIENIR